MSNATPNSRQTGDSRRRRSRGGKNRNRQNDNRDNRDNRRGGGERGSREARSEEFRPQGPRPPRGRPPVQLSWWQKLLKAIGLYKEPVRPPRKPQETKPQDEARPPKSNTRNARSGDGEAARPAAEKQPRRNTRGGDGSTVESPRVYVGNLSYDVTEQDLQELFKGIGGVRNVEIVYNRSTHRSKGYGFVEMLHKDEAVRAVEVLHDQPFMGRKLTVSGANSKGQDEREDQDDREDRGSRESRTVALAPLPSATQPAAEPSAEPAVEPTVEPAGEPAEEPVIQTVVENVREAADETPESEEEAKSEVA
jgi:hypothetical protein